MPTWVPALQREQCNDQALCSKFPERLESCPNLPLCKTTNYKRIAGVSRKSRVFLAGWYCIGLARSQCKTNPMLLLFQTFESSSSLELYRVIRSPQPSFLILFLCKIADKVNLGCFLVCGIMCCPGVGQDMGRWHELIEKSCTSLTWHLHPDGWWWRVDKREGHHSLFT